MDRVCGKEDTDSTRSDTRRLRLDSVSAKYLKVCACMATFCAHKVDRAEIC